MVLTKSIFLFGLIISTSMFLDNSSSGLAYAKPSPELNLEELEKQLQALINAYPAVQDDDGTHVNQTGKVYELNKVDGQADIGISSDDRNITVDNSNGKSSGNHGLHLDQHHNIYKMAAVNGTLFIGARKSQRNIIEA